MLDLINKIKGHKAREISSTAKKYADLEVAKMKGIDSKHCFCVNDTFVIGLNFNNSVSLLIDYYSLFFKYFIKFVDKI